MFSKKMIGFQGLFLFLCLLTIVAGEAVAAEYWLRVGAADMTMANGKTVPVWGFGLDKDKNFTTTEGAVSVPGPTLRVGADDNVLIIHLMNTLNEPVSLNILGQRMTNNSGPVWTNFPEDTETWTGSRPAGNYTARVRSFTHETQPGQVGGIPMGILSNRNLPASERNESGQTGADGDVSPGGKRRGPRVRL